MNQTFLTIAIFFLILLAVAGSNAAQSVGGDGSPKSVKENRVIDFHSKVSLGGISLAPIDAPGGYHRDEAQLTMTSRKEICPGCGKQTIEVASNQYVCFEPNKRLFDNPKLLGKIDRGIDAIFIQCASVDVSDEGRADRMLQSLDMAKGLKELYVNRSDVSDKAILSMPIVGSLQLFSAFLVPLDGSCLKRLSQQPNMRCLMLWDTRMDQANYKYLPNFPKLLYLNVDDDGITTEGLFFVGKCKQLKDLSLRWNRQIVDSDLAYLSSLKHLEKLDLRATKITNKGISALLRLPRLQELDLAETAVTPEGIQALRPLHLRRLRVSDHNYTSAQLKRAEQLGDCISWEHPSKLDANQHIEKDTLKLFAPISKHRSLGN